jgi:hypothetical protein
MVRLLFIGSFLLPVGEHGVCCIQCLGVHILSLHEFVLKVMDESSEVVAISLEDEKTGQKTVTNSGYHLLLFMGHEQ